MKAVVLLSGGLDSTVNLYEAYNRYEVVRVLTFDYGQKAFAQELQSTQILCQKLGLKQQVISLDWLKEVSNSSLTSDKAIPNADEVNIQSFEISEKSAKSVWVPNRNGLFLNIAAAIAEGLNAQFIIPGFNVEEAQTFPDNSKDFLNATNNSFSYSTQNRVKVECFTIDWNKNQIVQRALELGVNLEGIWPCYHSKEEWCLDCESCLRFMRACESVGCDISSLKEKRRGLNAL